MTEHNNHQTINKTLGIPELLVALKDKKEVVRAEAALALGELQAKEAIPYLQNALKVENRKRARLDMYFALYKFGIETDLAPLLHMLKAKPSGTRKEVADRLVRVVNNENKQVILTALENALAKEEDEEVKAVLVNGLTKLNN